MNVQFSDRMTQNDFQGGFVKSIFAAIGTPGLISFGGGLPNPISFPIEGMSAAAVKVLKENGPIAMQYSSTPGYLPLRTYIAERYNKLGVTHIKPEHIVITNGSQQAIDMISAVLLNKGDEMIVEDPTYLAALQLYHLYEPKIKAVQLNEDGVDCDMLEKMMNEMKPKLVYLIPNFQNPTGLTYSEEVRTRAAEILKKHNCYVIEDNPYGELRFSGEPCTALATLLGEQCMILGTFSKTVSPGMRMGWVACPDDALREKLLDYKMTVDLHTNIFGQMVMHEYLSANDLDVHMEKIKDLYKDKAEKMMAAMAKYCPSEVSFTKPVGGMFIWATMPEGIKAVDVQAAALAKGVLVMPGDPFYEEQRGVRTMRINYSNSTDEDIEKGVKILGEAIKELMAK